MTIAGHLVGVTTDTDRTDLTADVAVGDTVLQVASTIFFDETDGGYLLLNGVKLGYLPFDDLEDDDAETDGPTTLTLTAPSTVAGSEGDAVYVYDPTTGEDDPVQELLAQVTIDDRDPGDALSCKVRAGLVDQLDSDFETYLGKAVELEVDDQGSLVLVDILGSKRTGQIRGLATDSLTVTALGDQTMYLTYRPIPQTEHLRWCGASQPYDAFSRDGWTVTIPDPDGALQIGDKLTMQYLYTDPTPRPLLPVTLEFIGASSSALHTITSVDIPAGTQPGDLLVLGGVHGFFGDFVPVNTTDHRMTMSWQLLEDFGSHWHGMTAYGFQDDSDPVANPVLVSTEDPTGDACVLLAAYRVTYNTREIVAGYGGTVPVQPPNPTPPIPYLGGIMLVVAGVNPGGGGLIVDIDDHWTLDAGAASTSQSITVWHANGTPSAHLSQADGVDTAAWGYQTIGLR